jgi:hypothetical protein
MWQKHALSRSLSKNENEKPRKNSRLNDVFRIAWTWACRRAIQPRHRIVYSTGDYGASEDTDITYIPLTAKYDTERWFFRLTVPYLRITGPGAVVLGPDGKPLTLQEGGTTARRTSEDGLGDIVAGATYNLLPPTENGFIFDVGAKVKFETADEARHRRRGLFAAGRSLQDFRQLDRVGDARLSLVRRPIRHRSRKRFLGMLGALYKFSDKTTGGLLYD